LFNRENSAGRKEFHFTWTLRSASLIGMQITIIGPGPRTDIVPTAHA